MLEAAGRSSPHQIDEAKRALEREARAAREKKLRERAAQHREAAETEPKPTERKRKRTRARKAEEEADRLAKEARSFRRFSLSGLHKVRAEWTLVCLCSNLLKLVRSPLALEVQTAS